MGFDLTFVGQDAQTVGGFVQLIEIFLRFLVFGQLVNQGDKLGNIGMMADFLDTGSGVVLFGQWFGLGEQITVR